MPDEPGAEMSAHKSAPEDVTELIDNAEPLAGPDADKAAARASSRRNWRTLITFIRPQRWKLLIGSILAIIATMAGLWTPRIIESVIEHLEDGSSVVPDVTLFAILSATYLVATLVQWWIMDKAAQTVVYDVRAALVSRFMRGRVPDLRERSTADLVSRATADAPLLQLTVTLGFISIVTAVTGVIGSIVLMGVIDGPMLAMTLVAVVILAVAMAVIMPRAGRERAKQQEAVGRMSDELDGSMRAVRTIKAARAERAHADAVLVDAEHARKHGFRGAWIETIAYEVGFSGMRFVTVFMLAFGAWRVSQGHLSIGALVAFVMYCQNFMMPLMQMADGFSTIQNGLAASKRIAEAQEIEFEEPGAEGTEGTTPQGAPASPFPVGAPAVTPQAASPEPALPAEVADGIPVLAFENVTARYKPSEPEVLCDISLTIPRRGHVAIVGPSGAGKSSTISLALRFLSPSSGKILLDGISYDRLTYSQVRSRFAFVEQDPPVLPGTVRDNLEPANFEHSAEELRAVLDDVGLVEDISAMENGFDTELVGATMTGGGRQRLAIARALLAGAEVLLLDDATSQIGGPVADSIGHAIRAAAERGAVVTIGNRLSTVRGADKIIVLDAGRIVAEGTHESLTESNPLYRSLVSAG